MKNKKHVSQRGRLSLQRYFQRFKEGEKVAVARELALQPRFPMRIQGKTGEIVGKRGKTYIVTLKDNNKRKKYLIDPIHLKRIKNNGNKTK